MRLRIAKVDQQAIAQILGDMPGKALDDVHTGGLVGADDFAQVFGVELPRQGGRVGEVAEHHRELAAFGLRGKRCGCRRGNVRRVVALRYGLLRRARGGRSRHCTRFSGPHQHAAIVVDREVVDLDQFLFEGLKRLLIQLELQLERAVGHPSTALEHGVAWSRISSKVITLPP
jgi:hypothetical protein